MSTLRADTIRKFDTSALVAELARRALLSTDEARMIRNRAAEPGTCRCGVAISKRGYPSDPWMAVEDALIPCPAVVHADRKHAPDWLES